MMPTTINYPETKRVEVVEEHFGQAIIDAGWRYRLAHNVYAMSDF